MKPPTKPVLVRVRYDQDEKLARVAREAGKTRSAVVRDALDRLFTPIPDAQLPDKTIYRPE